MASRDLNRYRKVYPHKRVRPREFTLAAEQDGYFESGFVAFAAVTTGSFTFTAGFTVTPSVVITSVDTTVPDSANVNVYVSAVSSTSVTFTTSAAFTGRVHFHAMQQNT